MGLDFIPAPWSNTFKDFDKVFVGFDDQFNRLAKMHDDLTKHIPNYPPYNIYKAEENKYVIELVVAGFGKQDVEITLDGDKLIVKGETKDDTQAFLYKGIATRAFTRSFVVDDQVVVQGAQMINGMLKIFLERIIPEHKKPRQIDITDEPTTVSLHAQNNPQLLQEHEILEMESKKAARKKTS